MTTALSSMAMPLAATWAVFLLGAAWRHRPAPVPTPARARSLTPRAWSTAARRPARQIDTALAQLLSQLARRPVSPSQAGRLGLVVLASALALLLLPLAAPVVGAAVWLAPAVRTRRQARIRRAAVLRHLAEVVDLFVLATGAGLTVSLAVEAVARRSTSSGPLGDGLAQVGREVELGRRLVDALGDLPRLLGEPVRPLVAALIASERYGAPLLDRLVRLAQEVRDDRRRRAEEAARRVPIKLLFPLVFCILPAFALLTVAPIVAGALRTLRL